MTANPLWTEDQRAAERLGLRLVERADVRAAREAERVLMLSDPVTTTLDGRLGLDRALDQWVLALAMREANGDTDAPLVTWNVANAPRPWFGHVYPGAAVAIDNPDNFNREIPIDGDGRYAIDLQFSDDPPQFSIVIEMEPAHHAGLGRNIGAFTLQQLLAGADAERRVRVTVGPEEADGPFHLRTEPGRIQIYTRDSQRDWRQVPARVTVQRLDPPAPRGPRSEDEVAAAVLRDLPAWVAFWRTFKDDFLGNPQPNTLVGPNGRDGGWGYLAGGRFRLADKEALIVTLDAAGSYYTGFQIADPWTISPDPMLRPVSLNRSQVTASRDGTDTYVVAAADPGIANWIDTTGLREGWVMARWQGVPAGADPARFIRGVRVVPLEKLNENLSAGVPRVDLAGRREQARARAASFAVRTGGPEWGKPDAA